MSGKLRGVAGLSRKGTRIFMAKRLAGGPDANRWELPGGKVDFGESDVDALKRELSEELGVTARIGSLVGNASHGNIELFVYEAHWEDPANGLQGQLTGWYTLQQIQGMDVPVSDVAILKELRLESEVSA